MNAPAKMLIARIGEASVTVPEELAVLAYLEKMIDGARPIMLSMNEVRASAAADLSLARLDSLPAIGADFEGGTFAGLSVFDNKPVLLVKLRGEIEEASHARYVAWCTEQGGLPMTRFDGLIFFNNLRIYFKQEAYWTGDDYAVDPDYAWCQGFNYGTQGWNRKSDKLRGVAVRRVPL